MLTAEPPTKAMQGSVASSASLARASP